MSLRQAVVGSLAVAQVNALQLVNRAGVDVHPLVNEEKQKDAAKFVVWNMCEKSATSNNLGGQGPLDGDEEMRVSSVKEVKFRGETFVLDLVATVAEGSEYTPNNAKDGNKVENCLGYTNVQSGSTAKLDFRFTLPGEKAAWVPPDGYVPKFKFTIMDMDGSRGCDPSQGKKNCVKEEVTFDTPIDHFYYDEDNHEFTPRGDNTKDSPLVVTSGEIFGGGWDNPQLNDEGILKLNESQIRRTVSVGYKGVTSWSISLKADGKWNAKNGRNFMWTGASNVADPEACIEWEAPTFKWDLCGQGSKLPSNNLGGQGPDGAHDENAEQEIRYNSVATVHGKEVDLRVTADGYTPHNVSRNTVITDRSNASIHGCFGAINVKAASKVHLTFSFTDHATGEILELKKDEGFGFSVFDIDQSNDADNEELVKFDTPYAREAYEGAHVEKVKDVERTFRSTAFGKGSDNIYEKDEANTDDQIAKTVKVLYNGEMTGGAAQWKVTFDVRGGVNGRNFLFGGCVHHKEDVEHPK